MKLLAAGAALIVVGALAGWMLRTRRTTLDVIREVGGA